MNDNAVIEVQNQEITEIHDRHLTLREIDAVDGLIDEVIKKKFKSQVHFGLIPGIKKESLFLPGAQLFNAMFRVYPKYETQVVNLPGNHINVISTCSLYTMTGVLMGTAQGSCSSMESKYRYRNDYENTGQIVPKKYWDLKNSGDYDAAQKVIGAGHTTKKEDGKWYVCKASGKIDNPDIADQWNTILKMANKRSYIGATQTAWALSGRYTQDAEDIQANREATVEATIIDETPPPAVPPETDEMKQNSLDHNFVAAMAPHYGYCNEMLAAKEGKVFTAPMHYSNAFKKYINESSPHKRITDKAVLMAQTKPEDDKTGEFNYLELLNLFVDYRVRLEGDVTFE